MGLSFKLTIIVLTSINMWLKSLGYNHTIELCINILWYWVDLYYQIMYIYIYHIYISHIYVYIYIIYIYIYPIILHINGSWWLYQRLTFGARFATFGPRLPPQSDSTWPGTRFFSPWESDHLGGRKTANEWLVGGFNHLENYKSMGRIIPFFLEK